MSPARFRPHTLLAVIVAMAILFAQFAGLTHRVEHPRDIGERVALAIDLAEQGALEHDTGAHHDCAAYDAAAVSDGPPLVSVTPADAQTASDRARLAHNTWLSRAPILGYASRAPPRG